MTGARCSWIWPSPWPARRDAWATRTDPGFFVIDIDGTWVDAHSEKEEASATCKRGFGFFPLVAYPDSIKRPEPVATEARFRQRVSFVDIPLEHAHYMASLAAEGRPKPVP
jgi:hypothetical protein